MKAWQVSSYAHPSKLEISHNVPIPTPGPSEVLIEIYSAALNFFEYVEFSFSI